MVAEQCRSRERDLRRSTRTNAEMLTFAVCTLTDRAERASIVCSVKCRIFRRISTEVRNAKTLTIVVRIWCLAQRREPTQPIDVEKRVGESDDESVMHRQRQGTLPRYDHHLCSDSSCWKSCRGIVTQSSFDGAEHE